MTGLQNSGSAANRFGVPCLHDHIVSNISFMYSNMRLFEMICSLCFVPESTIFRILRFVSSTYAIVKSALMHLIKSSFSCLSDTLPLF